MESSIEVLRDVGALVARAQEIVCAELQSAIAQRDQFTLALSGGSTPKPLYESLSQQELPWDKIHLFWGDERYVPPDHPDSNEGMARRAWIDHISIPTDHIHSVPTQTSDPVESARLYEQHLHSFFGDQEIPALDLILLGSRRRWTYRLFISPNRCSKRMRPSDRCRLSWTGSPNHLHHCANQSCSVRFIFGSRAE